MEYFEDLLKSAQAPSFKFPELLFHPMCNNFGDIYFTQDPEDYDSEAVKYDARFTRSNLMRARSKIKRLDRYLEAVSLYDDYMAYLINKYGGIEFLKAYIEAGDCTDYIPQERPTLKKNSPYLKALKGGIMPSIIPTTVDPTIFNEHIQYLLEDVVPRPIGEAEPDPMFGETKPTKAEAKVLDARTNRLARQKRVQSLFKDKFGVSSGLDFVDHWYANLGATTIDMGKAEENSGLSLVERARDLQDRAYMTEAEKIEEDMRISGTLYYTGHIIKDRLKEMNDEFIVALQQEAGVDVMGTLGRGMNKQRRKAIRARLGESMTMSKKEIKKAKKRGEKMATAAKKKNAGFKQIRDILLNNKVLSDGTMRFEDMGRDLRYAPDDDI